MVSVSEALPLTMSSFSFLLSGIVGGGGGAPFASNSLTAASSSANWDCVTTSMLLDLVLDSEKNNVHVYFSQNREDEFTEFYKEIFPSRYC